MYRSTSLTGVRAARCHALRPAVVCAFSSPYPSSLPCLAAAAPLHPTRMMIQQSTRSFAVKVSAKDKDKKNAKGGKGGKDDKPKKKKKGTVVKEDASLKNADLALLEQMLEQQLTAPDAAEPRSPAELALDNEYAKEYSRRCMSAHKLQRVAQMAFLKSRWIALNALPTPLRSEALKEDMTPWPKGFQPIPWTPKEYVKRFAPRTNSNQDTPEKK